MKPKQILMLLMAIRVRVISIIIILFILTACVVAKMPGYGDSTQRVQPEPTLGLMYIEETVVEPGRSIYPESIPTWTPPPPGPEYPAPEPYPAPVVPVPYP